MRAERQRLLNAAFAAEACGKAVAWKDACRDFEQPDAGNTRGNLARTLHTRLGGTHPCAAGWSWAARPRAGRAVALHPRPGTGVPGP
jgi:hypothetical protein